MMNRRGKRVVAVIALIIVLLFVIGMMIEPLLGTKADGLSDMQKQYNALEQQKKANADAKSDANGNIQACEQQISLLTQQISIKTDMIAQLKTQIAGKNAEIDAKQKELDKSHALYNQRLRAAYEMGQTSYIEILLGSGDFSELLSRSANYAVIKKHDSELFQKLANDKQTIENDKAAIESSLANVVASQNDLNAK